MRLVLQQHFDAITSSACKLILWHRVDHCADLDAAKAAAAAKSKSAKKNDKRKQKKTKEIDDQSSAAVSAVAAQLDSVRYAQVQLSGGFVRYSDTRRAVGLTLSPSSQAQWASSAQRFCSHSRRSRTIRGDAAGKEDQSPAQEAQGCRGPGCKACGRGAAHRARERESRQGCGMVCIPANSFQFALDWASP